MFDNSDSHMEENGLSPKKYNYSKVTQEKYRKP